MINYNRESEEASVFLECDLHLGIYTYIGRIRLLSMILKNN